MIWSAEKQVSEMRSDVPRHRVRQQTLCHVTYLGRQGFNRLCLLLRPQSILCVSILSEKLIFLQSTCVLFILLVMV